VYLGHCDLGDTRSSKRSYSEEHGGDDWGC
jgi:hypothetical protein